MESEKKNNGILVGILIGLVIALIIVGGLFATGTISFKQTATSDNGQASEKNQTDNGNVTNGTNTIQTKLIDNLNCSNSETTFNGITVKLEQKTNNDVCSVSNMSINGKDIKGDISMWVNSYEIYDNNVIILSGDTSGTLFTIYSLSSNQIIVKLAPNSLEGYWVSSYKTNNNKITIEGKECGEQCGNISTGYKNATFEIEYSNNTFSVPKLVSKSGDKN